MHFPLCVLRYLGHMYKGEALVALDRIADGIDELNPESVTDVSTTLPEATNESGFDIFLVSK